MVNSFFLKNAALLLLLALPVAWLSAGGKSSSAAVLSPEASSIYSQNIKLINEGAAQPSWLATLMEKNGIDLASVQDFILRLPQSEVKDQELAPWQQEFVLSLQKQAEQASAAYQSLRAQADALPDAHEKIYLQCLIDYSILNNGVPPGRSAFKKTLEGLRAQLKSVVDAKQYHLSDLYRLYADVSSRLIALSPNDVIKLSNDAKGFAEQAIKLDQNNGAAHFTLGLWYLNAPVFAGGDQKRAFKLLEQARELGMNNLDRVMSWYMSASVYVGLKQPDMARHAIEQALEIWPTFPPLLHLRREIASH